MMRIWTRWRRACTCRSLWPVIMSLVHLLMVLFIQSLVWPEVVVTPRHSSLEVKPITDSEIQGLRESARRMFYFGYDNYMRHAFPADELDPIHCTGRGADKANINNININDVLGDYSLSLVESLDMLAIIGNASEFKRAVGLVIEHVDFNKNNTVQVFEATIRVLGGLLSAHLMIVDPELFNDFRPESYDNELLRLAHDLGVRLLQAFDNSPTGLPHPRVNLESGVPEDGYLNACPAGIGTLGLEFGILSRLTGDPVFDSASRRAVDTLWSFRNPKTGLLGNDVDIQTGLWVGTLSSIGAGVDSFYEYLLKTHILFGRPEDLEKFNQAYSSVTKYLRRGSECAPDLEDDAVPPYFANVHMASGVKVNGWIDSMSAAFAALQVLKGDLKEAVCTHALFYTLWRRFNALPERFDFYSATPAVAFYPLRPELIESTYMLYQATGSPFYLHVGREIMDSLNEYTRARCGYATIHDVTDKSLEDRMESFFLSETTKYLFLLFDPDNIVNRYADQFIFSTEGHPFRIHPSFRAADSLLRDSSFPATETVGSRRTLHYIRNLFSRPSNTSTHSGDNLVHSSNMCARLPPSRDYLPYPLNSRLLGKYEAMVGFTA